MNRFTTHIEGQPDAVSPFRVSCARPLPSEVVEQLHVAAQLCEDLEDAGVELRFDSPPDGSRVRAVLVDNDGNYVRDVPLSEVVELELGEL